MRIDELKNELKIVIIEECDKEDVKAEDIDDNVKLFSKKSGLELDSLDALQISMALQQKYAIRLGDSKEFRRRVSSIQELAEYILQVHG